MPSVFRINTSLFILQAMRELYLHLHRFTSCQHLHTLLDFYICSVVFLMHLMVMQQGLLNKVFSCYLISFIGISHLRICRRKVSDSRYMHENHHTLVISVNTTGFTFFLQHCIIIDIQEMLSLQNNLYKFRSFLS